jgi:hypothetical protein
MCLAQKTALVVFDLPTTSLKELKEQSKLEADWKCETLQNMWIMWMTLDVTLLSHSCRREMSRKLWDSDPRFPTYS